MISSSEQIIGKPVFITPEQIAVLDRGSMTSITRMYLSGTKLVYAASNYMPGPDRFSIDGPDGWNSGYFNVSNFHNYFSLKKKPTIII